MFSFLPSQAYKKNRTQLQSIGFCMLWNSAKNNRNTSIFLNTTPSPGSTHQRAVVSQQSPEPNTSTKHTENLNVSIHAVPHVQEESCAPSMHWCMRASKKYIKHVKYQHVSHSHLITSQHSPASSRQPAVASHLPPGSDVPRSSARGPLLASPNLELPASGLKKGAGGRRPKALKY